jgi:hypothetical protein
LTEAAIVAAQEYPAAYNGAYLPGSAEGRLIRVAEKGQDEVVLPLRKSKIQELGLGGGGSYSSSMSISGVSIVLPEGTPRKQALAMLDEFEKLGREVKIKRAVA